MPLEYENKHAGYKNTIPKKGNKMGAGQGIEIDYSGDETGKCIIYQDGEEKDRFSLAEVGRTKTVYLTVKVPTRSGRIKKETAQIYLKRT